WEHSFRQAGSRTRTLLGGATPLSSLSPELKRPTHAISCSHLVRNLAGRTGPHQVDVDCPNGFGLRKESFFQQGIASMRSPYARRLRLGLLVCCEIAILVSLSSAVHPPAHAVERLDLEVRERGGLARGGYPAHALLKLPRPVSLATKFRLVHDGKPIVAQFRPDREDATAESAERNTAKWWL